jgi:biotin carboxyl carrier protein
LREERLLLEARIRLAELELNNDSSSSKQQKKSQEKPSSECVDVKAEQARLLAEAKHARAVKEHQAHRKAEEEARKKMTHCKCGHQYCGRDYIVAAQSMSGHESSCEPNNADHVCCKCYDY